MSLPLAIRPIRTTRSCSTRSPTLRLICAGYRFEHRLEDIQTLNERARRGELHISAISIHAYAYVTDKYALLPCGASMGDGYGPVVVRKRRRSNDSTLQRSPGYRTLGEGGNASTANDSAHELLRHCTVAVPGKLTSAFLALKLFSVNSSSQSFRSTKFSMR